MHTAHALVSAAKALKCDNSKRIHMIKSTQVVSTEFERMFKRAFSVATTDTFLLGKFSFGLYFHSHRSRSF